MKKYANKLCIGVIIIVILCFTYARYDLLSQEYEITLGRGF